MYKKILQKMIDDGVVDSDIIYKYFPEVMTKEEKICRNMIEQLENYNQFSLDDETRREWIRYLKEEKPFKINSKDRIIVDWILGDIEVLRTQGKKSQTIYNKEIEFLNSLKSKIQ